MRIAYVSNKKNSTISIRLGTMVRPLVGTKQSNTCLVTWFRHRPACNKRHFTVFLTYYTHKHHQHSACQSAVNSYHPDTCASRCTVSCKLYAEWCTHYIPTFQADSSKSVWPWMTLWQNNGCDKTDWLKFIGWYAAYFQTLATDRLKIVEMILKGHPRS